MVSKLEWVRVPHWLRWLGDGLVVYLYGLGQSFPDELTFGVELDLGASHIFTRLKISNYRVPFMRGGCLSWCTYGVTRVSGNTSILGGFNLKKLKAGNYKKYTRLPSRSNSFPRDSMTSCCKYLLNSNKLSLYGRTTISYKR